MAKLKPQHRAVFEAWNLYGRKVGLVQHRRITPDIVKAVDENLKDGWTADDMVEAIKNYCKVLTPDYRWTYKWPNLNIFLRTQKRQSWCRFHPNNFQDGAYLTDKAQRQRQQPKIIPIPTPRTPATPEQIAKITQKLADRLFTKTSGKPDGYVNTKNVEEQKKRLFKTGETK